MTREEAIKVLSESIHDGSKVPWDKIVEAVHLSIEALSQPSLPSNLDEAAIEAYPKMPRLSEPHGVIPADNKTHYLGDANEENRVAFKAGAEWMAGQGETIEGEVMKDINNNLCVTAKGLSGKEAKFGNRVIVQIRKK